jgi:hypothetical protein
MKSSFADDEAFGRHGAQLRHGHGAARRVRRGAQRANDRGLDAVRLHGDNHAAARHRAQQVEELRDRRLTRDERVLAHGTRARQRGRKRRERRDAARRERRGRRRGRRGYHDGAQRGARRRRIQRVELRDLGNQFAAP